jgi:hypothetical protein
MYKEYCHITAGFIMQGLLSFYKKPPADFDKANFGDAAENWRMGGFWLLAQGISEAVETYKMDWQDMVFEYAHCHDDELSIWRPTVNKMTAEEWEKLADDNVLPAWLEAYTHEVMAGLKIPKLSDEPVDA